MTDVDSGPGDFARRGAGGYNSRKRRFRENDYYDRRPQRRRFEEPLSTRVRKQILNIAESALRDPGEDIVGIAKVVTENFNDDYFINATVELLVQLAQEQPLKVPFIAAITLYINQQKPDCSQKIIEKAGRALNTLLEAGEWRKFKLLLRFLACLQPLFLDNGVFTLLDEMFNKAADLQSASSDDALGIQLVKIILLTIPYALASDSKSGPLALDLLAQTDIIASAPHEVEQMVGPYVAVQAQVIPQPQSMIALLQKQLQSEAANDWPLSCIPVRHPAAKSSGHFEYTKHEFPAVVLPVTINPGLHPLFPELYFSLYADQDVETVPSTSSLAASLIRDTLIDTINLLDFNRTAAAKFLIDVDCYFGPNTFVKRATPFDQLKDLESSKSTWKSEDCVIDAIFSLMLQLPSPEHKLVYYHSMITETCKIAPAAIAPSLGRAIRFLYSSIDIMDVETSYRFMDWFAHHLSNFDFRWKWIEWVNDVELPIIHPRKAFMLGVFDKEVRLSFAKRIRETLPKPYQPMIPATKDNDIPEYKYNDERTPHSASAKKLVSLLKRKAPEADIQEVFDSIISNAEAAGNDIASTHPALEATDAYMTSICYIGSKSLSHVLSYIERCKDRLISLSQGNPVSAVKFSRPSPSPESQREQIITSVLNYWSKVAPGVAVNIVDKLLNYTILTPTSVIEWALAPERIDGGRLLSQAWIYEMIERTVTKVAGRVRQIVEARHGGSSHARLPPHQVDVLDKALADERESMRHLFGIIGDALGGIVESSHSQIVSGDALEDDIGIVKVWGAKWRRAFTRKLAVEESVVQEAMKTFPPSLEENESVLENGVDGISIVGNVLPNENNHVEAEDVS